MNRYNYYVQLKGGKLGNINQFVSVVLERKMGIE